MESKTFKYILFILLLESLFANDLTDFSANNAESMLKAQSAAQVQTNVDIERKTITQDSKTQSQISALKTAQAKRNGVYVMLTINTIPLTRMINLNDSVQGLSFGAGVRSGVVSYLDDYIGIRGYFAFDFTSDTLSPFAKQRENHKGNFIMLSLGLDILIDFFIDKSYKNTLGFFMGIGAGGLLYVDGEKPLIKARQAEGPPSILLTGNVMVQGGLSAVILYKHRIELGTRFLPTQSFDLNADGILADYNFYVGYSYKF